MDYPYTLATQSLTRFLSHVQSAGIPDKVTQAYLKQSGFSSSNDRQIISILKFIGFIDSSGVPSDLWKKYRDRTMSAKVLAGAIKKAYEDLFSTFPDAQRKDNEALRGYFSVHTSGGDRVLSATVSTFKTLSSHSDFEISAGSPPREELPQPAERIPLKKLETIRGLTLNINIQLQLPATEDSSIYDKLFEALKKHLMSD